MDRFARTVLLCILLGTTACGGGNVTFDRIPETVCRATGDMTGISSFPDPATADRIYRKLVPLFVKLRGREVPFSVETADYTVTAVRLTSLRRSCDIGATVCVSPANAVKDGSLRLYYLAQDSRDRVFARGIAIVSPTNNCGQWQGEAAFHMLSDAAHYEDFMRMVFVSRERFNAAVQEIRMR